jgi:hypothetical protein
MWITQFITSPISIMGKTQEVNGAVAPASRLLDENREGHQPLQRTPTQTNIKLDHRQTTEPVWLPIHNTKENSAAGIPDTNTHRLGLFSERSNQQGLVESAGTG